MLVLSRGRNEKIVFPTLGIAVEILGIARNKVRIGVDAPPEIRVLRHELAARLDKEPDRHPRQETATRKLSHAMRNRLNAASLALHLSRKQLQAGLHDEASRTLDKALSEYSVLEQELREAHEATGHEVPLRRALLVEDNLNESELLAGYLRLSGFHVDTACDGQDALDALASKNRPDAVLLDMQMPRCDGPTTIRAIRANEKYAGLRVFAVSGAAPGDFGVTTGPEGIDRWFPKPIDPHALVEAIEKELGTVVL